MGTLKDFIEDHGAVSEVLGQILITCLVVILLGSVAASVFSHDKTPSVPRASMQSCAYVFSDKIYIKHCGGDILDTEDLILKINLNGNDYEYPSAWVYRSLGNKSTWEMEDRIEFDTLNECGFDIKEGDSIEIYLIDIPSRQLIQKIKLIPVGSFPATWRTPAKAIDTSGGEASPEQLREIGDGESTIYKPPSSPDNSISQRYFFDIKPGKYGLRPGDMISNVTLRIIYRSHDSSMTDIHVDVWDQHPVPGWYIAGSNLTEYNSNFGEEILNISTRINTVEDLENLVVRFAAPTSANIKAGKTINVDYVGLWVS